MVQAATQRKQEELATKYGVYCSCLLQLKNFDAVRFTAIDPMHNLFLGTAKDVFKLCVKKVLNKKDLKMFEDNINSVDVGTGIGRLPHRIASNCACCLHCVTVEELDLDLFFVLFKGLVTRKPFEMLADICSRLPVPVFTSYFQDRHNQSRSVVRKVWGIV